MNDDDDDNDGDDYGDDNDDDDKNINDDDDSKYTMAKNCTDEFDLAILLASLSALIPVPQFSDPSQADPLKILEALFIKAPHAVSCCTWMAFATVWAVCTCYHNSLHCRSSV